jgi:hypothetical protein
MSFAGSSSITFDTSVVKKDGIVKPHFDISFTDASTTSMTIDYAINGATCAVFADNGQTSLSHNKSGLRQNNNIFSEPLKITGSCTDDSFQLQVTCTIADDSITQSEAVSYNPTPGMAMANRVLEATITQHVKALISTGVKDGIDRHIKEFHSNPAAKKATKKAGKNGPAKKTKRTK